MQVANNRPLRIVAFDLRILLSLSVNTSIVILIRAARSCHCEYPHDIGGMAHSNAEVMHLGEPLP